MIRAVLGHATKPLELSASYREEVGKILQIPTIPANAWWATDYHFSWLAGALAVYIEGPEEAVAKEARLNRSNKGSSLVEGNQEDIDLVIARCVDLILIEAKGVGHWENKPLRSKLDRLQLLYTEYTSCIADANGPASHNLPSFARLSQTAQKIGS